MSKPSKPSHLEYPYSADFHAAPDKGGHNQQRNGQSNQIGIRPQPDTQIISKGGAIGILSTGCLRQGLAFKLRLGLVHLIVLRFTAPTHAMIHPYPFKNGGLK